MFSEKLNVSKVIVVTHQLLSMFNVLMSTIVYTEIHLLPSSGSVHQGVLS